MKALALVLVVLALAGCGGRRELAEPPPPVERAADWRRVATSADRTRLRNWRATWLAALASARAADSAAVAREPMLFAPDRALANAVPPPGDYRCRTFKLGVRGALGSGFVAHPWFDCGVADEDGLTGFYKASGSQRPVGLIFPDGDARGVFLGTLVLGDETRPLEYGRDTSRDLAGIVERIGERRWRIVFPEPRFESRLDVIELVPVSKR